MLRWFFNQVRGRQAIHRIAAGVCAFIILANPAGACSIPVYRYALENWEADAYEIMVLHNGPLAGESRAAADLLAGYVQGDEAQINAQLVFEDAARPPEESAYRSPHEIAVGEARLVVFAPGIVEQAVPIWDEPLTAERVRQLVDSPLRREISRRIIDGDSIVWVLLETGNTQNDNETAALLQQTLDMLQATLKLPEELQDQESVSLIGGDISTLRIAFSMVRLPSGNAEETFFSVSLLEGDRIPSAADEPIALPVFGRGRVLDGLRGKSINQTNLRAVCQSLISACPCQVKAQNPGRDLLFSADWTAGFDEQLLVDIFDLPPLVGSGTLAEATGPPAPITAPPPPAAPATAESPPRGSDDSGGLMRNMIVVLSLVALAIVLLVAWILMRPMKGQP
jgi:hypothetical protein